MNKAIALLLPALLAGCAGSEFAPLEGMPAALGETVRVGPLLATPRSVVEDSRCPYNVQCVHAGRLVVSTRLDGDGWSQTVPLILGEPYPIQGTTVTLVSGRPEKYSPRRRPRNEYRFIYEAS
jgi:hypothetical protein